MSNWYFILLPLYNLKHFTLSRIEHVAREININKAVIYTFLQINVYNF